MKPERRRHQINQRRLITNLSIVEQSGGTDMSAPSMRLDPPPVVNSLKHMLAIFADFQFNHHQTPIVTQGEQVDGPRAAAPDGRAMRGPELRVQRRDNQAGIEFRNVTAQN